MTYTEETGNDAIYNEDKKNVTTWDNGETSWDQIGNVAVTFWDISPTDFVEQPGNTPTYVES